MTERFFVIPSLVLSFNFEGEFQNYFCWYLPAVPKQEYTNTHLLQIL